MLNTGRKSYLEELAVNEPEHVNKELLRLN